MMWLTQCVAFLIEAACLTVETFKWMPTEAGVNSVFALLCLVAAVFDVCPRRVMALSALLYLLLSTI